MLCSTLACVAGRRKGGRKVKMSEPPALCALVFPLSLPFGRLPRRLSTYCTKEVVWKKCGSCSYSKKRRDVSGITTLSVANDAVDKAYVWFYQRHHLRLTKGLFPKRLFLFTIGTWALFSYSTVVYDWRLEKKLCLNSLHRHLKNAKKRTLFH